MKNVITITLLILVFFGSSYAQPNKKEPKKSTCKLAYNKELDIDLYESVDKGAVPIDEELLDSVCLAFKFKNISKVYDRDQMVTIAYKIDVKGKATFLKVLSPKNDEEIEREADRLVASFPIYKPCVCGQETVFCATGINVRLYPR